jgi:hypothetical protein
VDGHIVFLEVLEVFGIKNNNKVLFINWITRDETLKNWIEKNRNKIGNI